MKTSSAKAKGRRAAQEVREKLLSTFNELSPDDIHVTPSGVNGPDLWLSARAKELFGYSVECKNVERLNVHAAIEQSEKNTEPNTQPILAFRKNRTPLYATIKFDHFLNILRLATDYRVLLAERESSVSCERDSDFFAAVS